MTAPHGTQLGNHLLPLQPRRGVGHLEDRGEVRGGLNAVRSFAGPKLMPTRIAAMVMAGAGRTGCRTFASADRHHEFSQDSAIGRAAT